MIFKYYVIIMLLVFSFLGGAYASSESNKPVTIEEFAAQLQESEIELFNIHIDFLNTVDELSSKCYSDYCKTRLGKLTKLVEQLNNAHLKNASNIRDSFNAGFTKE